MLESNEVKQSRKVCAEFLKSIEKISNDHAQKSFYFTTLIVMHVLTQQVLDEMDPQTLSEYMKMINELRQQNPRL